MNLAPLLASLLEDAVAPSDELVLDTWREQWDEAATFLGESWPVEDAVSWSRETPAVYELLRVQSFDALCQSGPGLARVSAFDSWTEPYEAEEEVEWRLWDEAVDLRDGGFLAYPNDAEPSLNLSFYAPVVHVDRPIGDDPIRLATLVFELIESRMVQRVRLRDDSDGRCARYLVRASTGERQLSCQRQSCPGECVRRTWVRPGGVRRARCTC